jgi:hypothetical protein
LALPIFVKNKFIELQPGGYFVCSRPDLASPVPSAQTPLHLRHLYHQVVEFSHAALPLGWTSSTRIWTIVMSVVAAALRRHGMRTLLYVDDLLIACSSFEESSRARQIIEDTLLAVGIVRAPLKDCFDTPTQTLTDHLGFSISSMGKGKTLFELHFYSMLDPSAGVEKTWHLRCHIPGSFSWEPEASTLGSRVRQRILGSTVWKARPS